MVAAQDSAARFVGSDNCFTCHTGLTPSSRYVQDFVTLHEAETFPLPGAGATDSNQRLFHRTDKHGEAFLRLMTRRGAAITDTLGITDTSQYELGSARHAAQLRDKARAACLSCHANWQPDVAGAANTIRYAEEGVSCEACHGPASQWESPHTRSQWRAVPATDEIQAQLPERFRSQKSKAALGMVDVRNPIERAKQCASCHVGDVPQGKVITHEMYAAGHPPLPSFEIETFAAAMPAHWRSLREKGEFEFKDDYLDANGLSREAVERDLPRTKAVLIGALVAMRQSVKLLADQARLALAGDRHRWPELALFDCQSCHHELTSPSWRQQRGYGGSPPGRVYPPAWPEALVKASVSPFADNDSAIDAEHAELAERIKSLRAAFDAQPFGAPSEVVSAADALVELIDQLAVELSQRVIDRDAARAVVELLANVDDSYLPDYHSARQVAWALMAIATELKSAYPQEFSPRASQQMRLTDELLETFVERRNRGQSDFQNYRAYRAERVAAEDSMLERFEATYFPGLRLRLPAGQGNEAAIDAELPLVLQAISDYQPAVFREQLKTLIPPR